MPCDLLMLELALASAKILVLLWGINLVPPLLTAIFGSKPGAPLDGGRRLKDGQRILGSHKTVRGLAGALLAGSLLAALLLFPLRLGLISAALSMGGDLATSFIKRRFGHHEGADLPLVDHALEGLLPLIYLSLELLISPVHLLALFLLFLVGGRFGSRLYLRLLRKGASSKHSGSLRSRSRFKELTSCLERPGIWARLVHFQEAVSYHLVLASFLRACGLYERGRQNALAFRFSQYTASLPDLPKAFDGYRILFLSDLHLDGLNGLTERLIALLKKVEADVCLLGGDYRMSSYGSWEAGLPQMERLLGAINAEDGIMAVLGNHDCLEIVQRLQSAGVTFLINDAAEVSRLRERLIFVGVDDPQFYRSHDLEKAFSGLSRDDFTIFAAHSPVLFDQAPDFGARLYLAGHTHAGQIQLPGLGMVYKHCIAPRRFCHGPWEHKGMLGYTSAGVGVSGVPVRFNCRGEVLLVRLTRGQAGIKVLEPPESLS